MGSKTLGMIAIAIALILLFGAMWNAKTAAILAAVVLAVFGIYQIIKNSRGRGDDTSGNLLSPEQIAKRRENLDRILALAQGNNRLAAGDVQRALKISDAAAARYLEYLVNLGKLSRVGERGQEVYYQIVKK